MPNINERPVCHRAEDLVTYLYGEASEVEAQDFAVHLQRCDSCRSEFGVFRQVHESMLLWRNEALGSAFNPAVVPVASTVESTQFVRHERKLTAFGAVREFFSVSPLWLRAATAFAALLLCALGLLTISRSWNRPVQVANSEPTKVTNPNTEPKYSQQDVDKAVQARLDEIARLNSPKPSPKINDATTPGKSADNGSRNQLAVNLEPPKTPRRRGLSRQEREQLAKDLRLIPRDEDELPFVLADEPNQ
jgi:hypothetical protein